MENEMKRLQMMAEAVLQFKTQVKLGMDIDQVGEVVLDIAREFQDLQLYELIREAHSQRHEERSAVGCLNEAISYLHNKIDQINERENRTN